MVLEHFGDVMSLNRPDLLLSEDGADLLDVLKSGQLHLEPLASLCFVECLVIRLDHNLLQVAAETVLPEVESVRQRSRN